MSHTTRAGGDDRMRIITFKIDSATLRKLDALCMRLGITRSDAIRSAIKIFLSKHKCDKPRIRIIG